MVPRAPRVSVDFNSARLIRLLAEWHPADVSTSKQSLAERLGSWLGWADAISLSTALSVPTPGSAPTPAEATASSTAQQPTPTHAQALVQEVDRVWADLSQAILTDALLGPRKPAPVRSKGWGPAPVVPVPPPPATEFAPYRRTFVAHQRVMAERIGALRAQVRGVLGTVSPRLERLAALDAVMDEALSGRERSLLATVSPMLGDRFDALRKAHEATPPQEDSSMAPGWLAAYGRDVQSVLLAELDIRWQPVEGLMDALGHEINASQQRQRET